MPDKTRLRQSLINGLLVETPSNTDCDTFSCAYEPDPDPPAPPATFATYLYDNTDPGAPTCAYPTVDSDLRVSVTLTGADLALEYEIVATDSLAAEAVFQFTGTNSTVTVNEASFTPALSTLTGEITFSVRLLGGADLVINGTSFCPTAPTANATTGAIEGELYFTLAGAPGTPVCTTNMTELDTMHFIGQLLNPDPARTYFLHVQDAELPSPNGANVVIPGAGPFDFTRADFGDPIQLFTPPLAFSITDDIGGTVAYIAGATCPTDPIITELG